jgi:hypothetical protein
MITCLCICHQHILNGNGILGKIKEYIICFELQHHGFIHVHIILWLNENDLQIITIEIRVFIPILFDKTFIPPMIVDNLNYLK